MKRRLSFGEVVTIVVCVAVMALILFPVSHGGKMPAKETACISFLKQLGTAAAMYEDDHDDRFPLAANWADELRLYTKSNSQYICPLLNMRGIVSTSEERPSVCGHAFYRRLSGKSVAKVDEPASTPLFFDSKDLAWGASGLLDLLPAVGRHKDGRNGMCFADGHVSRVTRAALARQRVP